MTTFILVISSVFFACTCLSLIVIFLISPSGRIKKTREFFDGDVLYAHRGLHGGDIPENSLPAFEAACVSGYGIELDIHLTRDEKLVVFHDDTLARMCGADVRTEELTLDELMAYRLGESGEHIPSFDEVLALVDGRAPLIIELKGNSRKNMRLCELAAKRLDSYGGKYCIEAFNPFFVRWFKKNRPEVVRGQLSCKMRKTDNGGSGMGGAVDLILENMLLSVFARPDFVAYDINSRHRFAFKLVRALGAFPVAWTVRSESDMKAAEESFCAAIFENIMP